MQKATRNTFYQKGGDVQKIDQGGVWAIVIESYLNPDYDRICLSGESWDGEDKIISVAKWVYRCKRLLRKSGHIVVSIENGEILEPCYFIEPSIHTRFENGTLVWLEPLTQLNGYLLFPGGIPDCPSSEYYYEYGSGSGTGIGSDSGYYGSVSGSGIDYGSGTSGTGVTGIIDCSALLNCLCVQKDNQGRVTGVFIKNPDGSLTEIMDCGSGSGGSGIGGGNEICCPPSNLAYILEYNFVVEGFQVSGSTNPQFWNNNEFSASSISYHPWCGGALFVGFMFSCINNPRERPVVWFLCDGISCALYPEDDMGITVNGCPDRPEYHVTFDGVCASGAFILRPASGNSGGSSGNNGGGGGGNNQACCPPNGAAYVMDYNITLSGTPFSGTSDVNIWNFWGIGWFISMGGQNCYLLTQATCNNGNVSFSLSYMCPGQNCIADADDFDYTITGCPGNPTINITVKPGHPCLSGSFTLRPV